MALVLLAGAGPSPGAAAPETRPELSGPAAGRLEGMALGEIHPGRGEAVYRRALDQIGGLGAEWVLLPVYGFVDSAAAAGVDTTWEPPVSLEDYRAFVATLVRDAHRAGLKVLLIPYINVRRAGDADWRGNLRPPDWPAWFDSYRRFLAGWVEMGCDERVDMLGVGAELLSSERFTDEWRRTIAGVRRSFRGPLLYSSNWDHYRAVTFQDALDVIGLSGYYSLPYDAPATATAVESNWREVRDELILFSHQVDRRILFTEIGYPSVHGGSRDPWNYQQRGEPDPGEQARSLSAFINVWDGTPELAGVFFWNYSPARGGLLDTSYSVNGKPAATVIRNWFRGMERPAGGVRHSGG